MYEGGYYTLKTKLVKTGLHRHTALLEDAVSDTMLDAVNTVQKTRWRINPFIADVMLEAYASGARFAGFPPAEDEPLPARVTDSEWEQMEPEQRTRYKLKLTEIHAHNARLQGKRAALKRKLDLAAELRDQPVIYFPHALDFRGRVYPLPQDLNPQGDDIAKGLLMFAEGKPVTARGWYWLKIAMANAGGQDKLSFADRIHWVQTNKQNIIESVENPLDFRWWAQDDFDAPWLFLALANEYVRALKSDCPAECVVHVPVNLDATASGIQHLSAMGLDPIGARATNMQRTGKREDLYTQVAEAVKQRVSQDAAKGVPEAQHWIGHVERSTVKRAVMTTPYGVTPRGIRDQLIADNHTEGLDGREHANAEYMKGQIIEALESTVLAARQIMDYIQGVSRALAEAGIPLRWTTPVGMKVQQSYFDLVKKETATLYGKIILWDETGEGGLNVAKQAQSAAPNFVHSFDAAHLAMTVNRAREQGITDFSLIHDSYGTHACDVDRLAKIVRETFVELYSVDRLAEFEADVREYAPGVELPPRPPRGPFNLRDVLESEYFFS